MKEINKLLKDRKQIVFLDFEGTQYTQEIMAIGAVKVSIDAKNNIKKNNKKFIVYINPFGEVGKIVEGITGLNDEFLQENGTTFKKAIEKLKKFVGLKYKDATYVTYGNFDKRLLHCSQELNEMENDPFIATIYENYMDFSAIFSKFVKDNKGQQLSLAEGLKVFKINFVGTEHDPSDDAYNLMLLYEAFVTKRGILLEQYKTTLDRFSHMPTPFIKLIRKLNKDKQISYDDYLKFIEEEIK